MLNRKIAFLVPSVAKDEHGNRSHARSSPIRIKHK